jgi:hypothetical protein
MPLRRWRLNLRAPRIGVVPGLPRDRTRGSLSSYRIRGSGCEVERLLSLSFSRESRLTVPSADFRIAAESVERVVVMKRIYLLSEDR